MTLFNGVLAAEENRFVRVFLLGPIAWTKSGIFDQATAPSVPFSGFPFRATCGSEALLAIH